MHSQDNDKNKPASRRSTLGSIIGMFSEYLTGADTARLTREKHAFDALCIADRARTATLTREAEASTAATQTFMNAIAGQNAKVAALLGDAKP